MATPTPLQIGLTAANPAIGGPVSYFGRHAFGGGHSGESSWQSGGGLPTDPDELAVVLGTRVGQVGYDSNVGGSFESTYNNILNQFTPDQLIKRYSTLTDRNSFNTGLDYLQKQAYDTAKSILGRDISGQEFAQILPAFQGPNGLTNGRAFIANLAQQYKMDPKLDPSNPIYHRDPNQTKQEIGGLFTTILGRNATADELDHFSQAVNSGQTDAYGISSFLKQQPEYTNAQDKTFREGLNKELTDYDTDEFNRNKGDILSMYGRNFGGVVGSSPSLDYALTDLMGQIAKNRGSYLASLSAQQYGGNKDLAIGNYKQNLDQMYAQNSANRTRSADYGSGLLERGFGGADYTTQRNDYMDMLNRIPRNKPNVFDYLNTGANVVRTGADLYRAFQ